jgi:hypothetical protein
MQVPRALLERTGQSLDEHVLGCLAELGFNLDEIDISDWEDRKTKKVFIAAAILGQMIYQGVSRKEKHVSVTMKTRNIYEVI